MKKIFAISLVAILASSFAFADGNGANSTGKGHNNSDNSAHGGNAGGNDNSSKGNGKANNPGSQ